MARSKKSLLMNKIAQLSVQKDICILGYQELVDRIKEGSYPSFGNSLSFDNLMKTRADWWLGFIFDWPNCGSDTPTSPFSDSNLEERVNSVFDKYNQEFGFSFKLAVIMASPASEGRVDISVLFSAPLLAPVGECAKEMLASFSKIHQEKFKSTFLKESDFKPIIFEMNLGPVLNLAECSYKPIIRK